jgi:hypothetical protein
MQGLVPSNLTIDGRTRILDLEKFINELLPLGKKLVLPFKLIVDRLQHSNVSACQRFCDEFSRDQRAGMCNVTASSSQVYIVPAALKSTVSLLNVFQHEADGSSLVLYAIIVSKEASGPASLVTMDPESLSSSSSSSSSTKAAASSAVFAASTSSSYKLPSSGYGSGAYASSVPSAVLPPAPYGTTTSISSSLAPPLQAVHSTNITLASAAAGRSVSVLLPSASAADSVAGQPRMLQQRPPQEERSAAGGSHSAPIAPQPGRIVSSSLHTQMVSTVTDEMIQRVATFCSAKGPETLQMLREKPESKSLTPFLFEGHPRYGDFMKLLKYANN